MLNYNSAKHQLTSVKLTKENRKLISNLFHQLITDKTDKTDKVVPKFSIE